MYKVEAEKEGRDGDLTRALGMLGKYERVRFIA